VNDRISGNGDIAALDSLVMLAGVAFCKPSALEMMTCTSQYDVRSVFVYDRAPRVLPSSGVCTAMRRELVVTLTVRTSTRRVASWRPRKGGTTTEHGDLEKVATRAL